MHALVRRALAACVVCALCSAATACGTPRPVAASPTPSAEPPTAAVPASAVASSSATLSTATSSSSPTARSLPAAATSAPAPIPSSLRPRGTATDPFASLHLLARRRSSLVPSPEPAVSVPRRPSGVYALSPTVLVVAASDGLWRTTDAGQTWQRTLPLAESLAASSVGPAGAGVVASTTLDKGSPTTLHVSDDGLHWRDRTPLTTSGKPADLFLYDVMLEGVGPHAVGFAYPDIRDDPIMGRSMLRTQDGGQHWDEVNGSYDVTDVARLPGAATLFAAAASGSSSPTCDGHVIRSDDAGLHWTTVASSCTTQNLFSVDFVDALHGFAAGGTPNHYGGSQLLLATDDGGRTWQPRFSTGAPGGGGEQFPDGFAQVHFHTTGDGLAVSGACVGGGDGPCGGQVWRTTDGGRSWHDTRLLGVQLATAGSTAVLTGSYATEAGVAVSLDGGVTWSRAVAPADHAISQLYRTGAGLTAVTNDGVELSTDGGHAWRSLRLPVKRSQSFDAVVDGSHGVLTSHGFRLSWQASPTTTSAAAQGFPDHAEVSHVALGAVDDSQGLAMVAADVCRTEVFATSDGGRSWSTRGRLAIMVDGPIGNDGRVAAAIGECTPPTQIDYAHTIALSPDDGHSWRLTTLGPGYDLLAASVAGHTVWVMGADTKGDRVVLVSGDDGRSWTANELVGVTVPVNESGTVVALSAHEALLIDGGSSLWRTTDGGATWRQEHAPLPTR